ncbi:hypothetical protein J3A72_003217 [Stenotrophomonas sp. PvP093]|uniref:Uncharacterized protein n=1 Tax=Stenotrophomonas pavanii TaxID=487698 RepID=A0A2D0AP35_9GAMM|nr:MULTISPECIES: hypothetical protein [Stenotrophomonas]MBP2482925.1 hypothetical protein [Stenotrophomonas sp. PvP093]OWR35289.1 hypothetical protein CEE55_02470 [Stenotrophomonas pavanii]
MNRSDVLPRFLADTASHELRIVVNDGVHRHLQFRRPGTYCYGFDIVTWPGHLAISGDMGTAVFSRLHDMFEFFRAKPAEHEKAGGLFVNDGYWAEKCVANDGAKQEFSARLFRDLVTRLFKEHVEERVDPDDLADPDTSAPEWVARLWQELELEVLSESEDHDALSNAISSMSDFKPSDPDYSDFQITDAWEYASSLQQYTFHFVWRLYAIARAVRAYDDAAGAAEPTGLPSDIAAPAPLAEAAHA